MTLHKIKNALKSVILGKSEQEKSYFNQHFFRYQKTLGFIPEKYITGKKVVDLGALPGHLSRAIKFLGANEVIGLDYDPQRFEFKYRIEKQGVKMVKSDIEKQPLPFGDKTVDLVIFTEVIEHFQGSPQFVFLEIKRILKPGGMLVITTPNRDNLPDRIFRFFRKKTVQSNDGLLVQQLHHHEYCMEELVLLLQKFGFNINKKSYIAGTEISLLEGTFPRKNSRILGIPYAIISFFIPPLRSYLIIISKKLDK